MSHTAADPIVQREVRIAAPPETVFQFLIDPARMVEWMGRRAEIEPRPGGIMRIDINGFDVMRGQVVEVAPPSRLVFTLGWESLADTVNPGESRVEITLMGDGAGTLLRLVHSGLPEMARSDHAEGWDYFLPRLAERVAGGRPESVPPLTAGEELASTLNTQLVHLRWFIERCNDALWNAPCANDERTVGVVAQHAIGHLVLVDFGIATGAGERAPAADLTGETLNQFNAQFAAEHAHVGRAEALAFLKTDGPAAVERLKPLTGEQLAGSQPMAFAGGAQITGEQVLLGPLLADIAEHVANLERTAV